MTGANYSEQLKNGLQLIKASEKGDIEAVKSLLKKMFISIHRTKRAGAPLWQPLIKTGSKLSIC